MRPMTRSRSASAPAGFVTGESWSGEWMIPASIAAWLIERSAASLPK